MGCGPENPAGLGLSCWRDGDRVRGEATLDRRQEGAPGYAHGGAITTLIDDTLGCLLMVIRRAAVTARLEVDFRSPAPLNRLLEVEAWQEEVQGRKLRLAARVSLGGETIAEGRALFLEVPIEHFSSEARSIWAEYHQEWPH